MSLSPIGTVSLADVCVTEWRSMIRYSEALNALFHSLMFVLLNGGGAELSAEHMTTKFHSLMFVLLNGGNASSATGSAAPVSLADVCVTEWRTSFSLYPFPFGAVSLADVCVTEWRSQIHRTSSSQTLFHSLMFVLLNGGGVVFVFGDGVSCFTR